MAGFMDRLKQRLDKTRAVFTDSVKRVFTGRRVDDAVWEELEQVLIEADLGVDTALPIIDDMKRIAREREELIKYGWPDDVWCVPTVSVVSIPIRAIRFHVDDLSSAHVYLRLPEVR